MKKIVFTYCLLFLFAAASAQIYVGKSCEVKFLSDAPTEKIEAINKTATPVLNAQNGSIQVKVPIIAFKFKSELMEEHFNENYMETEKYPHATFKGKINEPVDYTKDGTYKVTVTGNFDIHGVTKEKTINGTITIKNGQVIIDGQFPLHIADFNIKVPSLYVVKIAEDVTVTINSTLELYKKP